MLKMRNIEIAVGALMIAGIAALLMLALQVSGLSDFFKEEAGYKVAAQFENIGGLKVRAKVSVAGVVVGRVTAIELDPDTFNAKVTMSLDPDRSDKFPSDSQASIMTAGLLGDNYITLTPGFNEGEFLQEGSTIPIENTHSALILEKLISKFMANQVSGDKTQNKNKLELESDKANSKDSNMNDFHDSKDHSKIDVDNSSLKTANATDNVAEKENASVIDKTLENSAEGRDQGKNENNSQQTMIPIIPAIPVGGPQTAR